MYLRTVGPIYGLYGLGMALYFATQGFGSVVRTVSANAVRLLASTGCALVAMEWLDLGAVGLFVSIAGGILRVCGRNRRCNIEGENTACRVRGRGAVLG